MKIREASHLDLDDVLRVESLAFGHDEELGGDVGAKSITDLLESRGVRLWFSLDEGMAIVQDMGGVTEPIAMIGVAEKGYMTLELIAHAQGGHSSMPPRESAIGRLATAIGRVEASPLPAHLEGVAGDLFDALAPMLPAGQRFAIDEFAAFVIRELPGYMRPYFVRLQQDMRITVTFKHQKVDYQN